jgi:hypothetical protein
VASPPIPLPAQSTVGPTLPARSSSDVARYEPYRTQRLARPGARTSLFHAEWVMHRTGRELLSIHMRLCRLEICTWAQSDSIENDPMCPVWSLSAQRAASPTPVAADSGRIREAYPGVVAVAQGLATAEIGTQCFRRPTHRNAFGEESGDYDLGDGLH